jgi:serine/threonine protein kinase
MSTLEPNPAASTTRRVASSSSGKSTLRINPSLRSHMLKTELRSLFVVGQGGMGSVEVALETTKGGGQSVVALKRMLPSGVLDKRQIEMFLREAKLASLLVHPNVVHATSFGEISGELLLVMEYVEGEPLSRVLAAVQERYGCLALPFVAYVLAEICEGLHAAHELRDGAGRLLNVVHRDVSPHNVMVAYEGQIKLLDFGVAKIEAIEADGRTKTGEVKGKTAYMSPEQAMGDAIDRRSDIYSLGAVLFEAVSGRKMWGGGTDLEVLRRLALEEPPALSNVAPGTPPAICQLQERLVARDPSKRPSTALEVAEELRAFIAHSGARTDRESVSAFMAGLFASEIGHRRTALRVAVEKVASGTMDEVQGALPSEIFVENTPAPATRPAAAVSQTGWRSGLAVTMVLVVVVVVIAAVTEGSVWRQRTVATASPPAPMSLVGPQIPSAAPSAPPSSSIRAPDAEAASPRPAHDFTSKASPPSSGLAARQSTTARPTTASPPSHSGALPPQLRPPSAPKPSAPLDVDPTPF